MYILVTNNNKIHNETWVDKQTHCSFNKIHSNLFVIASLPLIAQSKEVRLEMLKGHLTIQYTQVNTLRCGRTCNATHAQCLVTLKIEPSSIRASPSIALCCIASNPLHHVRNSRSVVQRKATYCYTVQHTYLHIVWTGLKPYLEWPLTLAVCLDVSIGIFCHLPSLVAILPYNSQTSNVTQSVEWWW